MTLALLAGLLTGQLCSWQWQWPGFPPSNSSHWVFWGLLPWGLLTWLQAQHQDRQHLPGWRLQLFQILRLLLLALICGLLVRPLSLHQGQHSWSLLYSLGFAGCFSLLATGYLWLLDSLAPPEAQPAWQIGLLTQSLLLASGWAFLSGSSASLMLQAGVVLFACLPLWITLLRLPALSRVVLPLYGYALLLLWLQAWVFAELNPWGLLLLALPLAPLAGQLLQWQGLRRRSLDLGLALAWLLLSLGLMHWSQPEQELYLGLSGSCEKACYAGVNSFT